MKFIKSAALLMVVLVLAAGKTFAPYEVGDSVSDFKLKNVDGKMVSLSDYKNSKGVIVIFDCNTCPYSQKYNDRIIKLNDDFASKGFPVIAINPNDPTVSKGDSFDEMVSLAKRKGYKFPYLVDEDQSVAKAFGATNTPHVYLLTNENNAFKVSYIGSIDDNAKDPSAVTKRYVEEAIDALLNKKEIPTNKTKAIGCTIKWKNA